MYLSVIMTPIASQCHLPILRFGSRGKLGAEREGRKRCSRARGLCKGGQRAVREIILIIMGEEGGSQEKGAGRGRGGEVVVGVTV